jgi:hypothetical protein
MCEIKFKKKMCILYYLKDILSYSKVSICDKCEVCADSTHTLRY